ncbi:ABC-three component system middle component 7 [Escherichia coli]|uniref:ABC-three component system middle component 7 n=1 Tax=Escherichia coli TaxID=562 RepID=UPI0025A54754|nr:ABC-three component system middle component 7 [Escherichia coli]
MIVPNKATSLRESILFKMLAILEDDFEKIGLLELYDKVSHLFDGIDEFVFSLDVLFIIEKIRVNEKGIVEKC